MTYDDELLSKDDSISYPYIIRSNFKDNGYLPFVTSILHNSTYTMVVKDEGFEGGLPDGDWLDDAIAQLDDNNNIVACSAYREYVSKNEVRHPEGCMFMRSLSLRSVIVNTAFKRNQMDPFLFFSDAFHCLFDSSLVIQPFFVYKPQHRNSRWMTRLFQRREMQPVSCRKRLNIKPISCKTRRPNVTEVSIVLSQYKREYVYEQIEAIYNSSVPVREIIVYQNAVNKNYKKLFRKYPQISHIWSTNWNSPFFMRHLIPLLFLSPYYIIFDDDIIPGPETIRQLLHSVRTFNAPAGVGGRVILESNYTAGSYRMKCVDCTERLMLLPVDFVIQVYARSYVMGKVYWKYRPWTHRNGDDIHGSMSWFFECGRRPVRPSLNGMKNYKNYGTDNVASYKTKTHNIVRPQAYRSWIISGFESYYDLIVDVDYPTWSKAWSDAFLRQYIKYFCSVSFTNTPMRKGYNSIVRTSLLSPSCHARHHTTLQPTSLHSQRQHDCHAHTPCTH